MIPTGTKQGARISELLQVHGGDPLTVAQQTDTSPDMIEKAHQRFVPAALQEKLARNAHSSDGMDECWGVPATGTRRRDSVTAERSSR